MTDHSPDHAERARSLAAGLTKAQREALLKAELDDNVDRYFTRFISEPAGRSLVKAGLGTAVWSGVMLSELGLAVRASLHDTVRGEGENG